MGRISRKKYSVVLVFGTNATTATLAVDAKDLNGYLVSTSTTTPATVDSSATATVSILDADGSTIYSKGSLAANTTTVDLLTSSTLVPLSGSLTLKVVFSQSQTANRTTSVVLIVDKG